MGDLQQVPASGKRAGAYLLIGGMGSGKSTVSQLFESMGACVVDFDAVGHDILDQADMVALLSEAFGEDVVGPDGSISKPVLAKRAFATDSSTAVLNGITHPRIAREGLARIEGYRQSGCPLVIAEVSAYGGHQGPLAALVDELDGIIAVSAPADIRLERAQAKGFTRADVINRMNRQPSDEQRASWADFVIVNDGSMEDLKQRTRQVFDSIVAHG